MTGQKLKVNVISESAFTVQGHGVHTAYTETLEMLGRYTTCDVRPNTNRPADIIHLHTVGPYAAYKLLFGRGAKVVSAHVTPDSFVGSLVGAKMWYRLAKAYLCWFYNRAQAVLAVSGEVEQELKVMGVTKPVYLVPNTINTQHFRNDSARKAAARAALGIAADQFVVLGNGQVQPRKRLDCFVAAAKALPEITFVWVGGMPFKKLAAQSAEMHELMDHPPANVTFTGTIPREAVVDYFVAADLFFLPSNQETFGIVIVEAAAAGLPVLLRDLAQYRETFGDGYERGNDSDFTDIVEKFSTDAAYHRKWQQASRAIAERYDAKAGAAQLLQVYLAVVGQSKGK